MDSYNDKNYIKINKKVLYIHPIKMKYINYVLDEMTTYEFNELLIKVKEINELKDENDLKKN